MSSNVDVKAVITAEDRASKVLSDFGSNVRQNSEAASVAFEGVANSIGNVLKKGALLLAAGSFGIGAAAKASWDQVSAVQQATVALNAYEKDTNKVNAALASLVKYAQSDMGVLFNRKDLFASAQALEVMGDSTQNLSAHVQILSRSVGLGLSTWDDLNQIVGRIGSTGRLTGIDFDNLTKAGFRLDNSLRNTDITYTQLFAALDKGIPVDAMAGQANTIQGISIRLQTAFRGIGNAILGVDTNTNQFVKGGLGDTLVNMLRSLTDLLKTPIIKEGFAQIGAQIGALAAQVIPLLIEGLKWLLGHIPLVETVVASLAVAFLVAKGAAMGFALAAEISPVIIFATAITALVGVLTYLQLQFSYVSKALDIMKPSFDLLGEAVNRVLGHFSRVTATLGGIDWGDTSVRLIRDSLILLNATILRIPHAFREVRDSIEEVYNRFTSLTPIIIIGQFLQQVLWPALKAIAAALWENLLPALSQLWDAVSRLWNSLNPALTDALKIVGALLLGLLLGALWAVASAINIFVQALSFMISIISNVIDWVSNLIGWFGNLVGVVVNAVTTWISVLSNLVPATKDTIGFVVAIFATLGSMILNAVGNFGSLLYDTGKQLISGLINGIQDKVGEIGGAIGKVAGDIGSSVKGALHGIHVPGFATGGLVPGPVGAPMLAVVHGGEYVIPNGPNAAASSSQGFQGARQGNNVTINLTVQAQTFLGSQVEARKHAMDILKSLQEIAVSRNTSLASLLGAA